MKSMEKELLEILPQRPPMVMIDALVQWEEDRAVAVKVFKEGDYGLNKGLVLEPVMIECMAQTVAAFNGKREQERGRRPARGMLVGVQDVVFKKPVSEGEPMEISVKIVDRFGPFSMAEGVVKQKDHIAAQGTLKFYVEE